MATCRRTAVPESVRRQSRRHPQRDTAPLIPKADLAGSEMMLSLSALPARSDGFVAAPSWPQSSSASLTSPTGIPVTRETATGPQPGECRRHAPRKHKEAENAKQSLVFDQRMATGSRDRKCPLTE
jgi:hypothetical protein